MFCRKCGVELRAGARFCTKCGQPVQIPSKVRQTGTEKTVQKRTPVAKPEEVKPREVKPKEATLKEVKSKEAKPEAKKTEAAGSRLISTMPEQVERTSNEQLHNWLSDPGDL